jgi:Protein of unknown function (DUF3987)/Toprim-like
MTAPDVPGFYANLGVTLPTGQRTANVSTACFINPDDHRHGDRNKSMSVSLESGVFQCHGCGAAGGAYDAALARGRTPRDAMQLLRDHGILNDDSRPERPPTSPKPRVTDAQIRGYNGALLASPAQVARLAELRGWSREAIERFEVGVDAGYRNPQGGGPIVFPSRDQAGVLTGCVRYQPNPAKRNGSKSRAEGPRQLYPPPELIDDKIVWLFEGESDAIAAHAIGLAGVAVPGAESWKDTWVSRFRKFETVVVCTDDDEAGQKLAERLIRALAPVVEVRRVELGVFAGDRTGDGYDLSDAVLEAAQDGGVSRLRDILVDAAAHEVAQHQTESRPADELGRSNDEDWPTLSTHPLPEFPVDALPRTIAEWATAVAEESQTPVDLPAMAGLGVLSAAALGAGPVDCGQWEEELALYVLVSMPSGDRKSTVLRAAVAPLRTIERELREAAAPDVRANRTRVEVLEKRKAELAKQLARESDDSICQQLEGELMAADEEVAEIGEPTLPRLLADDATPEALGGLLARHGSIAVIAAESALLDNLVAGKYSERGTPNLHLACSAYGGESTMIDRRSRDPEEIERPLMTIALAVQPHVLDALVSHPVARQQGLVARFAYAMPSTRLGRRRIDASTVPDSIRDGWASIVRHVYESAKTADKTDKTPPLTPSGQGFVSSVSSFRGVLTLTSAAKTALDGLRQAHEERLREAGDLRPVADWAARHPGRVVRIAGLLHLACSPAIEPIGETTMRSAIRIGDYLLTHALAALTGPDGLTRRAVAWLAERGQETVTIRDLHRGPLGSRGPAEKAAELAHSLEQLGAVRAATSETGKVGRPSAVFEVHPLLRSRSDSSEAAPC